MTPGPSEEIGQTARSMVDAFKSNPVMLGMVLIILAQVGLIFYITNKANASRDNQFQLMLTAQGQVQELLARCVVPDKT